MFYPFLYLKNSYFNPRSREGSDTIVGISVNPTSNFNPRSREGSDTMIKLLMIRWIQISIHAPAKGATPGKPERDIRRYYFNPRSREGSDQSATISCSPSSVFQSTLPRRERQIRGKKPLNPFPHFNPRSREGSDKRSD